MAPWRVQHGAGAIVRQFAIAANGDNFGANNSNRAVRNDGALRIHSEQTAIADQQVAVFCRKLLIARTFKARRRCRFFAKLEHVHVDFDAKARPFRRIGKAVLDLSGCVNRSSS